MSSSRSSSRKALVTCAVAVSSVVACLLAYSKAVEWKNEQERAIEEAVRVAIDTYPWLEQFVLDLEQHWLDRYRYLAKSSPDELVMLSLEDLQKRLHGPNTGSTHEALLEELAYQVGLANFESYVCTVWPAAGHSDICDGAKRHAVVSAWDTWLADSGLKEDYFFYSNDGYLEFGKKVEASVQVCNLAPYEVQAALFHQDHELTTLTEGWYSFQAGECTSMRRKFSNVAPSFFVHFSASEPETLRWVTRQVNVLLAQDDDPSNDDIQARLVGDGWVEAADLVHCVSESVMAVKGRPGKLQVCSEGFDHVGFNLAVPMPSLENSFFYAIEHPNLSLLEGTWSDQDTLLRAQGYTEELAESVSRQIHFDEHWSDEPPPFLLGATLVDFNGPFNPGVGLDRVLQQTIFGAVSPLENLDIVVSVNGRDVFGERDLLQLLINHGMSRQHGIRVPVELGIFRGDRRYNVRTTYLFNEEYSAYEGSREGLAIWYGATGPITFDNSEWATCAGGNVLKVTGKILGALLKKACEGLEGENCQDPGESIEYHDLDECKWQQEQKSALARQKHRQLFTDAQWLGIFSPSGVRVAMGRRFGRQVARTVGRNAISRGLSTAGLEAIETGLWSLSTAPPGEPLAERLEKTITDAKYGAGLGFVSGLLIPRLRS